jgi:hypothetical protein
VQSLLEDASQIITLDANFFISPDRQREGVPAEFERDRYVKVWIEPFFQTFPNLAIHEAVLYELLPGTGLRSYADEKIDSEKLLLLRDSDLTADEMLVRNTKELLIAPNTQYDPDRDNKGDRGEVKSLAYWRERVHIFCLK